MGLQKRGSGLVRAMDTPQAFPKLLAGLAFLTLKGTI